MASIMLIPNDNMPSQIARYARSSKNKSQSLFYLETLRCSVPASAMEEGI